MKFYKSKNFRTFKEITFKIMGVSFFLITIFLIILAHPHSRFEAFNFFARSNILGNCGDVTDCYESPSYLPNVIIEKSSFIIEKLSFLGEIYKYYPIFLAFIAPLTIILGIYYGLKHVNENIKERQNVNRRTDTGAKRYVEGFGKTSWEIDALKPEKK